jgi:hypothetical protein
MSGRVRGFIPTVAGVLCVVGLTAGCGSSGAAAPGPTLSGASGADTLRGLFTAAMTSHKTVTLTSTDDMDGGPTSAPQTCQVEYAPVPESECETSDDGSQMKVILLPDALYVQSPDASSERPWRKIDPHSDDIMAQLGSQMQHMTDEDLLAPGVSTVAATHADTVGGKSATRYDLTVDLAALARSMLPQTTNDVLQSGLQKMISDGGAMPAQIWLDSDNLPLQQITHLAAAKDQPVQTQTMAYSNWAAPVTITPPPPDQVSTN